MQTYFQKQRRLSHGWEKQKTREIPAEMKKVVEDDDLLTEILVRIRPAIVVSFMSVSKRWLNLISSRPFRLHHSSLSPAYFPATSIILQSPKSDTYNPHIPVHIPPRSLQSREGKQLLFLLKNDKLVYETKTYSDELDLFFPFIFDKLPFALKSNPSFKILHASNGLLLVSVETRGETRYYQYYVCNPLTQDCIRLPPLPDDFQSQPQPLPNAGIRGWLGFRQNLLQLQLQPPAYVQQPYVEEAQQPQQPRGRQAESGFVQKLVMRLVFDPLKSAHYKVVRISDTTMSDGSYICVQVYSSMNRSWGRQKRISSCSEFRGMFDSVLFNDVLCWTTSIAPGQLYTSVSKLFTFDMVSMRIRSLPMPPRNLCSVFNMCEPRRSLYLVERYPSVQDPGDGLVDEYGLMMGMAFHPYAQQTQTNCYKIWEMKDIQDPSWELIFEFKHEDQMDIMHIHSSHNEQGLKIYLAHNSLILCLDSNNYAAGKEWDLVV